MTDLPHLEWLKNEWPELLQREEEAYEKCCELDRRASGAAEKAQAVREWWLIINAVLWMFVRTRAQYNHELKPFPMYPLGRLANISEEVGFGNVPSLVTDARKGGRGLWRKERHHIAYGVAYIEAVKRGEIVDRAPNKTVRQAYNVTARAVQGWVKRSDEICVGVPFKHLEPDQLRARMFEAAEVYSRIGRGAPAAN